MIRIKKELKISYVIVIVILSLAFGIIKAEILKSPQKANVTFEESKKIKKIYINSEYEKKIKLFVKSKNFKKDIDDIQHLIIENNIIEINSELKQNNYQAILSIPNNHLGEIYKKLSKVGFVFNKDTETKKGFPVDEKMVKEEIEIIKNENRVLNLRLQSNNISSRERTIINKKLKNNFSIIDSLIKLPKKYENIANNTLIYLFVNNNVNNKNLETIKMIKFIKFSSLGFLLSVGASLIFYLLSLALMFLMDVLGVKTERKSSKYGYHTNKKTKRIYKKNKDDNT